MNFLIPFFLKFLPTGWLSYLLIFLVGISAGFYSGFRLEGWRASFDISLAHTETAHVQQTFDAYKVGVLAETARSNAETVSKMKMAQGLLDQAHTRLQQQQTALAKSSAQLTKVLNEATQTNDLSPSSIEYFRLLRGIQTGGTNPVHP